MTVPNYSNGYNDDVMINKNSEYDNIIRIKNIFYRKLYNDYKKMFKGKQLTNLTSATSTYVDGTSNYKTHILPSSTNYDNILSKSNEVQTKRLKMDADISRLNSSKNISNNNDTSILYNSYFFINLLWIILATTLIYYIFTEI